VLVASGGRVEPGPLGDRYIADLAATALAFCGVPSSGLDGTVISRLTGGREPAAAADPTGHPAPESGRVDRGGSGMSDEDNEVIAQHLRDLGYIE
jgi:hypothetical protein